MRRTAFLEAVDDVLQNLSEDRDELARKGSATSELAHALVESVRHDVQIAAVVGTAVDVAMRVTTGLSLAGLISQRDGERISTLISTTGEVAGTIGGTTDWEARMAADNAEELGIGSDRHG